MLPAQPDGLTSLLSDSPYSYSVELRRVARTLTHSGLHHRSSHKAVSLVAAVALVAACSAGGTGAAPSGETPVDVSLISLVPASAAPAPEVLASVGAQPSVAKPVGEPSVAAVTVDYTLGADDLPAFAAAYRAAFAGVEIDDAAVDVAGARLCTYLMRQAGTGGSVALDDALAEAEVNEPGYAPEDWITAFGVATAHYCGEYTVEP